MVVLTGISAGISFHFGKQQQKRSELKGRLMQYLGGTKGILSRVPRWFWISGAPAYASLFFPKHKSWVLGTVALACGGAHLYFNFHSKSEPEDKGDLNPQKPTTIDKDILIDDFRDLLDRRQVSRAVNVEIDKSHRSVKKLTPRNYLELLVHNISHSDVVYSLNVEQGKGTCADNTLRREIYFRPRFSCFDKYSQLLLQAMDKKDEILSFPRYMRSMEDPRYTIQELPSDYEPRLSPTGFRLATPVAVEASTFQQEVRIRGSDQDVPIPASPKISQVYFPLLAALIPIWEQQILSTKYKLPVKRVLILVTGVGTPRNRMHSMTGNSTQKCATLMEVFLSRVDPSLTVVKIHSERNLFRYDENLLFVEHELMPTINAYRDAHATGGSYPDELPKIYGTSLQPMEQTYNGNYDWRSSMQVIMSFTDGSPARTHAIQASLRPFRPAYFHFWRLKTFWHESKVVDDDIEVHSFETMEVLPAVDVEKVTDKRIQAVVREMRAFYAEMTLTLATESNDILRFWLRKSHKPVLAVLLVQSPDMEYPRLYRGTNMEVSMPTGSLCAERNAIGSALAANPNLKRQDLKLIAVLAVPPVELSLDPAEGGNRIKRSFSVSSIVVEDALDQEERRKSRSRGPSFCSESDPCTVNSGEWILPVHDSSLNTSVASSIAGDDENEFNVAAEFPLRRISLFSKSSTRKRTVVVHSAQDINPLSPCGACNEWLKKIAESNPYFKIVTFTDALCNGIYVSPCQE